MATHDTLRLSSGSVEALKWIAVATMVVDHIGSILFDRAFPSLGAVGRVAFPLFAFLLVHNQTRFSRGPWRQVLRLVVIGVVTQPIYMHAFDLVWRLNILLSLALGSIAIIGVSRMSRGAVGVIEGVAIVLGCFFVAPLFEYGLAGLALILACRFWISFPTVFGAIPAGLFALAANWFTPVSPAALLGFGAIWALRTRPVRVRRMPGWFFYAFYPGHIALLSLVRYVI